MKFLLSKSGFSDQPERVNVLLTRAKFGLIVIGHEKTLNTSQLWSNWLKEAPGVTEDAVQRMISASLGKEKKEKKKTGKNNGPTHSKKRG